MASRIRTHLILHTLPGLENASVDNASPWNASAWQPRVDVYEMAEKIVILVEAPGLQIDNLKLQFEPGELLVAGIRTQPELPEEARAALVEMHYGPFRRRFALPANANGDGITATYDAGILQITVPRSTQNGAREIQVQTS